MGDTVKPLRVEITTLPTQQRQQQPQREQQQQQQQQQLNRRLPPLPAPDNDDDEDFDEQVEKTMQARLQHQRDSGISRGNGNDSGRRRNEKIENEDTLRGGEVDDELFDVESPSKALHSLVNAEEGEGEDVDGGFVGSAHSNTSVGSEDSGISSASAGDYVCEYSELEKLEEVKKD